MRLGAVISPSTESTWPLRANACQRAGYSRVQVNFGAPPTPRSLQEVLSATEKENLSVIALGCYGNPLQPDSRSFHGVNADDLKTLLELLPSAHPQTPLSTPLSNDFAWTVITWSGTLSGRLHTPHPGNTNKGALLELFDWTHNLLPLLEEKNAQLLFKPSYAHVLGTPDILFGFLTEIDSPHVGLVMDPCSFLTPKTFHEREVSIEAVMKRFSTFIGLAHLKDARIENFNIALTGPGQGQLGYAGLLKQLQKYCPTVPWLVDAVGSELQLRRAREYVELQARLACVS